MSVASQCNERPVECSQGNCAEERRNVLALCMCFTSRTCGVIEHVKKLAVTCPGDVYRSQVPFFSAKKVPKDLMKKETTETPSVTPVCVQTVSKKKLMLLPSSLLTTPAPGTSSDGRDALPPVGTQLSAAATVPADAEMAGYRLIRCDKLASAIHEVGKYRVCDSPLTVGEELGCRHGLISRLSLQCTNPEWRTSLIHTVRRPRHSILCLRSGSA